MIDIGAFEYAREPNAGVPSLVLTSSDYSLPGGNSLSLSAQWMDVTQRSLKALQPMNPVQAFRSH